MLCLILQKESITIMGPPKLPSLKLDVVFDPTKESITIIGPPKLPSLKLDAVLDPTKDFIQQFFFYDIILTYEKNS